MLSSRKIDDLVFPAKLRALNFIADAKIEGIDLLVTCTVRDVQAQNALFAHGRTRAQLDRAGLTEIEPAPGPILTNAKGGDSFHQYGVALDVVPLRAGKPVWGTAGADRELWERVGRIGEARGLEWAGRWKRMREFPHFQFTGGLRLADFRAGKTIPPELAMPAKRAA